MNKKIAAQETRIQSPKTGGAWYSEMSLIYYKPEATVAVVKDEPGGIKDVNEEGNK